MQSHWTQLMTSVHTSFVWFELVDNPMMAVLKAMAMSKIDPQSLTTGREGVLALFFFNKNLQLQGLLVYRLFYYLQQARTSRRNH